MPRMIPDAPRARHPSDSAELLSRSVTEPGRMRPSLSDMKEKSLKTGKGDKKQGKSLKEKRAAKNMKRAERSGNHITPQ